MGSRRLRSLVLLSCAFGSLAFADASGRGTYLRHCAPCHGASGEGDGPQAELLDVKPRDFTKGTLHFRAGPAGAPATVADYERTIRRGIPSTSMPAWDGVLSDEQIRNVATYARGFAPESTEVTVPVPIPGDVPAASAASEARGRTVFLLIGCWACHGLSAKGDGPASASPLIRPTDFTHGDFRSGGSAVDLYRTVITGMAGVPMPAFGSNLALTRESTSSAIEALKPQLSPEELKAVESFATGLRPAQEWDALTDVEREAAATTWRWELVHYVQATGRRSAVARYLFDDPYLTH